MRSEEPKRGEEGRREFECSFDPDTGDLDEPCVREYLESSMPLAV